jgi:hypothetical protein
MYAEIRRKLIINKIWFTCRLESNQYKINKIWYWSNDMDMKYLYNNCIFKKHDFLQFTTMDNAKATAPTFTELE